MGNLALMLQDLGWRISGSDGPVYPPMSRLLEDANIEVQAYSPVLARRDIDCFVIGNSVSRGNPLLETILNQGLPYISGPALLAREVLEGRDVIAVAGTHGKTTTTSMLAHIFARLGRDIGYLVGGSLAMDKSGRGGRVGEGKVFVIEADEYDSAFCDKRAKFVHYRPRWVVMNNLEFDHADIYPDLAAIETQFHHLVRLAPGNGAVIYPHDDAALARVIKRGLWSKAVLLGLDWRLEAVDGMNWRIHHQQESALLDWRTPGEHNARNALAAVAAAHCAGVNWKQAVASLTDFVNAERRMQFLGERKGVRFYTDFAHHPTAIAVTLKAMSAPAGDGRLLVILHPASNSMKSRVHKHSLPGSLHDADGLWLYQPGAGTYDWSDDLAAHPGWSGSFSDPAQLAMSVGRKARTGDLVVSLSNGDIAGVHQALLHP